MNVDHLRSLQESYELEKEADRHGRLLVHHRKLRDALQSVNDQIELGEGLRGPAFAKLVNRKSGLERQLAEATRQLSATPSSVPGPALAPGFKNPDVVQATRSQPESGHVFLGSPPPKLNIAEPRIDAPTTVVSDIEKALRERGAVLPGVEAAAPAVARAGVPEVASAAKSAIKPSFMGKLLRHPGFYLPATAASIGGGYLLAHHMRRRQQEQMGMPKSADVSGSELAPFTAGNSKATLADQSARALGLQAIKAPPASDKISVAALRKLSSLQTGRFADPVNQRYPLDSLQDVVEANGWLDKYAAELPPRERRSMAQAICRRSEELGIPMGKVASAEGHTKLASLAAVRTQLEMRSTYYAPQPGFGKEAAKAFELLKVKVADLHPEVLVETIAGLDHKYGGDRVWGSWLADPWSCVFEKSADDTKDVTTYAYDAGNLHVSGTDIVRLAKHSPEVDRRYGKEFAEQFRADPIGFFDHLPMPEKEVLGHMAHEFDRSGVGLPVDRG